VRHLVPFRVLPLTVLALVLAACGRSVPPPKTGPGAPAAVTAVERFLQLGAAKDYAEMGWIFGTTQGPIIKRDPPGDVERRMFALASVLQHEMYAVRGETAVPGRVGNAMRVEVQLTNRGRTYDVPFTVVRGPGARWFIEQIGLEAVTGAP
jgi:hypothetical protein